jgi:hypothetical protein
MSATVTTNDRQFRAVTYLRNGQRFEGWLPPGRYILGGVVKLSVGRESSDRVDARELFRDAHGRCETWYVGEAVLSAVDIKGT